MSETFTLLVYAVLAAASPVTLIATLVVLGTADARRSGIAFAAGFVLGQAAGLGIPLIVGLSVTSSSGENSNVSASFELAVGLLMLLAASRMFSRGCSESVRSRSPTNRGLRCCSSASSA